MFKIAVFGFFRPDQAPASRPMARDSLSPINTDDFMRMVWEMEPLETRIGVPLDPPCFVKLTGLASQPVYVQRLSDQMAPGAGLLNFDGYVLILDAVKILAPRMIRDALRRLADAHPHADLIVAAGRQNEPDALSSDEIREVLGLHPALPVYPYVPSEPKTVHRLTRRLVRYIDDPERVAPPIFAGDQPAPPAPAARAESPPPQAAPAPPHIDGLAHVAITVSDLGRSLAFYRGLLGFRLLGHLDYNDERGYTITYLDAGRAVIKLFSYASTTTEPDAPHTEIRQGLQHIALRVTGMDVIVEQLKCAGVPFRRDPVQGLSGAQIAFLTDPDGTIIELIEGDMVYTRQ
jgi:catechol 2,3-dioxygenase-like lactoylglutathione lyase family enzyme